MAEPRSSLSDVRSTLARTTGTVASSSSSGDEGSTCSRRGPSANGRQKDASLPPPDAPSSSSTFEMPCGPTCVATAPHISSPSSPSEHAEFYAKAMCQSSSSADAIVGPSLKDEEDTESPLATSQVLPEDTYGDIMSSLSEGSLRAVSNRVIAWANQSKEENSGNTLARIISLVFEKATDDTTKLELYAKLCRSTMDCINPDVHDYRMKDREGNLITGPPLFCRYLLNHCQEEFQRGLDGGGHVEPGGKAHTGQQL